MAMEITWEDGRYGTAEIEWTSDGSGNATETITQFYSRQIKQVKTVPGAGVSAYSVTLLDTDDYDWFAGEGASRSTTDAEAFFGEKDIRLPKQDLILTVSGAGSGTSGTVYIQVE